MVDAPRFGSFGRASLGLALALALGACGGGGGGGGNGISFSFTSASTTLPESAAAQNVMVVLHTTEPTLAADVTVEVADAGSGTATSGSDYAAFAPVVLTFTAGEADGATRSVTLDPLDDALVEAGNETVRLRLQNPSGAGLSGATTFTATLTDIHAASVAFATPSATTPDEGGGAESVALELDCGTGVSLGVAVSVRVSDLRTGSAVPPSDYSSFAARTVTFPIGSSDGAVQTVTVGVVNDTALETNETVVLGLSQPSATCTLGANTAHTLTITDDDLAGNAAFLASEGAAGTENPLAYDESIALGNETVGAGPNAGTLLRVTNGGGTALELGTPSLGGTHDDDFAVEVESSSLGSAGGSPTSGFPAGELVSPLVAREDSGPGVAASIDAARLARLGDERAVVLRDFELPLHGPVTLELAQRRLPIAADAVLAIDGVEVAGGPRALVGDLQLWTGNVAGVPGSRVFLALSGEVARGFVALPAVLGGPVHLFPDGPGRVRLLAEPELAALGLAPPADFCAGQRLAPSSAPDTQGLDAPPSAALNVAECRLALETDWQLYQQFGNSALLDQYVVGLIGAVSDQYFTDVQTTLSIAYLGIHTSSNDGWTSQDGAGDAGDLLDEFRAAWTDPAPNTRPAGAAGANLFHFLSGANLGGGVAYVDVLCNSSFGFGVSGDLNGNINWALWTGASGNFTWDFVVVAHELGHNFGSQHTHDYCPPLDRCYTNCNGSTTCTAGTIMSYCHACGGMSNIELYFHPVTANIMRQNVNASCLDDAVLSGGDFVQYRVRFNPLTTTGAKSATLQFTHDATNATQPFRVRLTGTAN
jgi:hypothetical protein